jgi:hypothetical protein
MTITTLLLALITATSMGAAGEPVLLDFHATWCGPCQQMRPAINELIRKGYRVKEIDIDESPDLAARYQVTAVPTFIIVDPSGKPLARLPSVQPAAKLATLYREAKARLHQAVEVAANDEPADDEHVGADEAQDQPEEDADRETASASSSPTNPKPWETGVRIRIDTGQGMIGYGSGTIIHSTPRESIILTCAHIFKQEGRRQAHPSQFPGRIMVDLFDGKIHGTKPAQVHYSNETYEGVAIDYDFGLDVGLIRIRPGRRLPASRVVPANWRPQARMSMITVGCSEGHDATAWSTTIVNPRFAGAIAGNPGYSAIECWHAPKQGRSGGGLYTEKDYYVAGVCDFAEPRGNHGLYASPASIHKVLDRNNLTALYAPVSRPQGRLIAENRSRPKRRSSAPIARAQSPDRDESNEVTIPPPELLGITVNGETTRASTRTKSRRAAWQPIAKTSAPAVQRVEQPKTTDIKIAPMEDEDEFAEAPAPRENPETEERDGGRVVSHGQSKWRPAKPAPSDSSEIPLK